MRTTVLAVLVSSILCIQARGESISIQSGRSGAPSPLPFTPQTTAVYSLPPDLNGTALSSEMISTQSSLETETATDFVIPGSGPVEVTRVRWWGAYFNTPSGYTHVTSFVIRFFSDRTTGCLPGTPIATYVINNNAHELFRPGGAYDDYEYYTDFRLTLNRGQRYWCSIRAGDHLFPPQWGRLAAASLVDCQSAFRSALFGYPTWSHADAVLGASYDASLELDADVPTTELITILTGQVGGQPDSICGQVDDCFRWYAPNQQCGQPIINPAAPIPSNFFTSACNGPPAPLVTKPIWGTGMRRYLIGTPFTDARWINYLAGPNCTAFDLSRSVLYCCTFFVQSQCSDTVRIDGCWKADDLLGDTQNTGVFIDGLPLSNAFKGGGWSIGTCASQSNLQLTRGWHRIEVYQQDTNLCQYSGLEFGCTITLKTSGVSIAGQKVTRPACVGAQTPVPGWIIRLRGTVNDSTVTDANGNFSFAHLPRGRYSLTERTLKDWIQCLPQGGTYTATDSACSFRPEPFVNSHCDYLPDCVTLPASLVSWYTFDEGTGNVAKDFAAGANANFSGVGAWSADPCGAGGHSANLTSATPLYLTVPSKPLQNDVTTGSFGVFAWIRMTSAGLSGPDRHYIVDKQDPVSGIGYALYIWTGYLYCEVNDGFFHDLVCGNVTPLTAGVSYCVGVNVSRDPSHPASDTVTLYLNCVPFATGFCGSVPPGSLSNASPLTIGTSSMAPLTPFLGYIDDLQIYKGAQSDTHCLTAGDVCRIYNSGNMCNYCKKAFYVPSITGWAGGPNPGPIILSLCNFTGAPQTLTWTIAGLTQGDLCCTGNRNGPTVFAPSSGTLTVPAYNTPPSCTSVSINTEYTGGPPWYSGDTGCYQVTIQDPSPPQNPYNYAYCNRVCGAVQYPVSVGIGGGGGDHGPNLVVPGTPWPGGFRTRNLTGVRQTLYYRLSDHSADRDSSNQIVSLNGLPPGTPVTGTLTLAAGDSGTISFEAELTGFQPFNVHEVLLSADWNHNNHYVPTGVIGLQGVTDDYVVGVPPALPAQSPAGPSATVTAAPNPFVGTAGIRFRLESRESAVLVNIFDVGGRLVRELNRGPLEAGSHQFVWDGKDLDGRRSAGGIYFIRVQTAGRQIGTKLIRIE